MSGDSLAIIPISAEDGSNGMENLHETAPIAMECEHGRSDDIHGDGVSGSQTTHVTRLCRFVRWVPGVKWESRGNCSPLVQTHPRRWMGHQHRSAGRSHRGPRMAAYPTWRQTLQQRSSVALNNEDLYRQPCRVAPISAASEAGSQSRPAKPVQARAIIHLSRDLGSCDRPAV